MKRIWLIAVFVLLTAVLPTTTASAKSISYAPYYGYEYNDYDESTAAPVGYVPFKSYYSRDMGLEVPLDVPTDMLYDGKDFYILDSENERILQLDNNFKLIKAYENFQSEDGGKSIVGAKGFTIDSKGNFYIANTTNNEVFKADRDCRVQKIIVRPDDALANTDAPFSATKVTVDRKDKLYVIVDSVNKGAFTFDSNGNFLNFFGTNPVYKTSEVIMNFLRKRFMTPEQRKGLKPSMPTMFSNFDFDENGFLYTVTASISSTAVPDTVRLLNYQGKNIVPSGTIFGDLEWDRAHYSETMHTSLIDVDVDSSGFVNLLDSGRGRVFQYTPEGNLVAVFGTYSDQLGGFKEPIAIESVDEKVYVLDSKKNSVVCFVPTKYCSDLRNAYTAIKNSDPENSQLAWTNVMKQNTNSQSAYFGIGISLDAQGKYVEAMQKFKLAGAHVEYSKALREYRKIFIGENYLLLIAGVLFLVTVMIFLVRFGKKKFAETHGTAYSVLETKFTFPLYTAIHPSDGFDQFKSRKITSYRMIFGFVIAWFLLKTCQFFYTGFSFNMNRPLDYDFFVTLFFSVGLFILFVSSNWSVCTLLDGKGSLKEIMSVCAYSMLPYLVSILLSTMLSNILTVEEATFISLVTVIGLLWSALLLVIGLQSIHQYSFLKTISSIIMTVIGMFIIVFLIVLFYTLLHQTVNFVRSVMSELSLR